jgi:hypothetical protein
MGKKSEPHKSYSEKLKDPLWQKKRLEVMERDGWQCVCCKDKASTLNCHHTFYDSSRMPWEYDGYEIVTLCQKCHLRVTAMTAHFGRVLGLMLHNDTQAFWNADMGISFMIGLSKSLNMRDAAIPDMFRAFQAGREMLKNK